MADEDRDYEVRHRAYALWEAAGRPVGQHLKFWELAEREHDEARALDEGLADMFPASDPPASVMRTEKP